MGQANKSLSKSNSNDKRLKSYNLLLEKSIFMQLSEDNTESVGL